MIAKTGRKEGKSGKDLETAVHQLRIDIQQGRLVPGQRLVESDLMEYLGVSRGRVREAFKRLEAQGLVEIHKNRGASVRKISRQEVLNTMEVLGEVTMLMVKKVAARIDEGDHRARLKESLKAARTFRRNINHITKVTDYMEENARFYGAFAEIADNPVLSDIRLRLQNLLFRLAMEGLTVSGNRDKWITRHEEIITALLENNVRLALKHTRQAQDDVWDAILSMPDSAFGHQAAPTSR